MLSFEPKNVIKDLLRVVPSRGRDVLEKRYGIGKTVTPHTLESIGAAYGVTRERIRQIEHHNLENIRKSSLYDTYEPLFDELHGAIELLGSVVSEKELLEQFARTTRARNAVHFLLVLGYPFYTRKEDAAFYHRWYTKKAVVEAVERALKNIAGTLEEDELVSEKEILARLARALADIEGHAHDTEVLRRWLLLSKVVGCNPLGEWGLSASPNIRVKGIRDHAYLAVKRHGSPMHFTEVAASIGELFGKKAHVATTHNELIKDKRFVLVGRGLYALTEWGYQAGVVKEVLRDILLQHGPLSREEIIVRVRKERYVKDNTILINLQDADLFHKLPDGQYMAVP